jgi:hypothetical protein
MSLGKRGAVNPYDPEGLYFAEWKESVPSLTGSVSSSGSATTRRRKRRRSGATLDAAVVEESAYCQRFNYLEYVGKQQAYSQMHMEPSFSEPCEFFKEFLGSRTQPIRNFTPEDYVFVRSNSLVQLNHLDKFNRPTHVLDPRYQGLVNVTLDYVSHLLALDSKIPFPTVGDLSEVRFFGDKYPGIEYARLGYKNRREADAIATADAERSFLQLMQGERVEPHLNRIGGRGKMARRSDAESMGLELDKGRLIMMTSHRDLKLNGVTEQRLTDRYRASRYPIAVGTSWWHGGCAEFAERFREFSRYWCFDAKKFDANLPGWLIRAAINILREQFEDGMDSRYDAYWEFIYEGLVEAPMFLDNGLVFRRRDGSTSGHSFNTLVQSVCTLIIGYSSFLSLVGVEQAEELFDSMWLESLGDDQIGGGKDMVKDFTVEEVAQEAWDIFGINWFGSKSYSTDLLLDQDVGDFQGVQFLGKYFYFLSFEEDKKVYGGVLPYRPRDETLLRLFYPERLKEGIVGAWERAVGHYADSAGNAETRQILEEYLDFLEPRLPDTRFSWSESWVRKFSHQDVRGDPEIPGKRITFYEWLRLTLE